jgi:TonB family protein
LIVLLGVSGCSTPPAPVADEGAAPRVLLRQADARTHLTSASEPAYPFFAKAAGVTGAVHYEIDVSPEGRVTAARLIHGSPMLEQAARDAVVQWRFSPFQAEGRPAAARTVVTLTFTGQPVPGDVTSALERYADAMLLCADAERRSDFADAEARCAAALNIATDLSSFDRTSDVRPMRLYGEAVAAQGRHVDAITPFETVVARLRHVPVFSLDRALALRDLGHSLEALGRDEDALRAWRQADQQLSEALGGAERNSSFQADTIASLRSFLPQYANALDRTGRAVESGRIRSRLETLQ